jgi:hypothetical protein
MHQGGPIPENNDQAKVLAQAIFEIRVLLAGYLGSENDGELAVRQAAHLAYALHNQALAVLENKSFDVTKSIGGLQFADQVLGAGFTERFKQALGRDA